MTAPLVAAATARTTRATGIAATLGCLRHHIAVGLATAATLLAALATHAATAQTTAAAEAAAIATEPTGTTATQATSRATTELGGV
ncbi:hypothetical protein D3C85_1692600 [compost metagenome]